MRAGSMMVGVVGRAGWHLAHGLFRRTGGVASRLLAARTAPGRVAPNQCQSQAHSLGLPPDRVATPARETAPDPTLRRLASAPLGGSGQQTL